MTDFSHKVEHTNEQVNIHVSNNQNLKTVIVTLPLSAEKKFFQQQVSKAARKLVPHSKPDDLTILRIEAWSLHQELKRQNDGNDNS